MYALINKDRVIQLSLEKFEVHPSLIWMDAPEGCKVGWLYDSALHKIYAPKEPEITIDQMKRLYKEITDDAIKLIALGRDYFNTESFVSYVNSTNQTWKEESENFIKYRDKCWEYFYDICNAIDQKIIIITPTKEQFAAGLPKKEDFHL